MGAMTCLQCLRGFTRIILAIVNICVIVLGLLVLIVGIWSKVEGNHYVELTSGNHTYAQVPWLLIWMGIFVMIFGTAGVVGAAFANHCVGRIILGSYGFVLALFVIIEIAGGIAAGVERNQVGNHVQQAINDSFSQYNSSDTSYRDTWDTIQRAIKCCGTYGYASYPELLNIKVPKSCCVHESDTCVPASGGNGLYGEGCTQKVEDNISKILGAVAGVAITFGLFQIVGIVLSCFVAIAGRSEENTYQVV